MVNMGMGENDMINRCRVNTGITVFFVCSQSLALETAAIKKYFFAGWGGQ
jgi:hypothetical protein